MLSFDTQRCPGVSEDGEFREGCEDCLRRTEPGGDPQWTMTPPEIIVFECEARIAPGEVK